MLAIHQSLSQWSIDCLGFTIICSKSKVIWFLVWSILQKYHYISLQNICLLISSLLRPSIGRHEYNTTRALCRVAELQVCWSFLDWNDSHVVDMIHCTAWQSLYSSAASTCNGSAGRRMALQSAACCIASAH